jgi:L,D-transpeptidase ErfK/SrfK
LIRFTIAALVIASLTACQYLADLRSRGADEISQPSEVLPPAVRAHTFPLREDSDLVGRVQIVTTRYEDTLFDLARKFDLGIKELAQANPGVDKWVPGEGRRVILPTQFILPDAPRKGIVLNLAAMRLFYYPKPKPGETPVVITHPIGIGRENWSTPISLTKVVKKVANPSWIVPASIRKEHAAIGDPLPAVVPPGPDNPLGMHALRLGLSSYLIHGTNKPEGIGMRVSHGCIQLYPEDIETLFHQVPVGTQVRIVNHPYLAGWQDGMLYLQAHKPLEEQARAWGDSLKSMVQAVKKAMSKKAPAGIAIDWDRAEQLVKSAQGIPMPVSPADAQLDNGLDNDPAPVISEVTPDRPRSEAPQIQRRRSRVYRP